MKASFDNFAEPEANRRKFLLGLLFSGAAGLAAWRLPRTRIDHLGQQKLEDLVPKKIGRWEFVANSGLVVPPNDPLLNALYSQQLTRVYSDGQNPPLMLLMAQSGSQTGFLQVHRPDYCYTASGYRISPVMRHPISLGSTPISSSTCPWTTAWPMWWRIGTARLSVPGSLALAATARAHTPSPPHPGLRGFRVPARQVYPI